jgi:hypothetical protein
VRASSRGHAPVLRGVRLRDVEALPVGGESVELLCTEVGGESYRGPSWFARRSEVLGRIRTIDASWFEA